MHRLGAAAAVVMALTCVFASRGEAAFSGDNGRIVFQSNRDGNWEIYSMRSDGSDQTRLTNNPSFDGEPAVSPDGKKIAFVSDRGVITGPGGEQTFADSPGFIYLMNSDGSGQPKLLSGVRTHIAARDPSFSPDGKRIAFSTAQANNGCLFDRVYSQIFVMSADGGGESRMTRTCGNSTDPMFSPDGNTILFQGHDETQAGANEDIYEVDSHTYQPGSLPGLLINRTYYKAGSYKGFDLNPQGTKVVYSFAGFNGTYASLPRDDQRIWWARTGNPCACQQFEPGKFLSGKGYQGGGKLDDTMPSLAPEGNSIVYQHNDSDIFKVSFDLDPEVKQLTRQGRNVAPDWGSRAP